MRLADQLLCGRFKKTGVGVVGEEDGPVGLETADELGLVLHYGPEQRRAALERLLEHLALGHLPPEVDIGVFQGLRACLDNRLKLPVGLEEQLLGALEFRDLLDDEHNTGMFSADVQADRKRGDDLAGRLALAQMLLKGQP